eukprot:TRINITY_DN1241_c0_g1_i3.p1 TRINITY_DN1241_c0_g1~~TRINITY_DN1241_c0_g1_i3.p1  ORF type:complete len:568 (+),score=124.07 TRINITY_DN1241_c0_g1_i3:119-1822(+)
MAPYGLGACGTEHTAVAVALDSILEESFHVPSMFDLSCVYHLLEGWMAEQMEKEKIDPLALYHLSHMIDHVEHHITGTGRLEKKEAILKWREYVWNKASEFLLEAVEQMKEEMEGQRVVEDVEGFVELSNLYFAVRSLHSFASDDMRDISEFIEMRPVLRQTLRSIALEALEWRRNDPKQGGGYFEGGNYPSSMSTTWRAIDMRFLISRVLDINYGEENATHLLVWDQECIRALSVLASRPDGGFGEMAYKGFDRFHVVPSDCSSSAYGYDFLSMFALDPDDTSARTRLEGVRRHLPACVASGSFITFDAHDNHPMPDLLAAFNIVRVVASHPELLIPITQSQWKDTTRWVFVLIVLLAGQIYLIENIPKAKRKSIMLQTIMIAVVCGLHYACIPDDQLLGTVFVLFLAAMGWQFFQLGMEDRANVFFKPTFCITFLWVFFNLLVLFYAPLSIRRYSFIFIFLIFHAPIGLLLPLAFALLGVRQDFSLHHSIVFMTWVVDTSVFISFELIRNSLFYFYRSADAHRKMPIVAFFVPLISFMCMSFGLFVGTWAAEKMMLHIFKTRKQE